MKWCTSPIPEAIQVSKQRGSLFIVYIFGTDEMSSQMNSTWESDALSQWCENNQVVAIRMQNTSDDCKHFSQIYPVVVVPSTFCIGEGGVPLEVIGGPVSPEDMVKKLDSVQQIHNNQRQKSNQPVVAEQQTVASAAPKQESASEVLEPVAGPSEPNTSPGQATAMEVEVESEKSAAGGASGDQAQALPLEERVARARELIEKRKEEKAQAEFEKRRQEEINRRELGQGLQKLKRSQKDSELREVQAQLRKDKEDEKKAREKVRAQIARDREERAARFQKDKQEREKEMEEKKRAKLEQQQKEAAEMEAQRSMTARIQVRLPDGSSFTQTFPSTDTLQTLHTEVTQRMGGNASLSMTFPKRRFTDEDMSRTFSDLQLSPSAVLIALPGGNSSSTRASSSVATRGLFSMVLAPFMLIWNFLYSLFFGSGNNSQSGDTTPQQQSDQSSVNSERYTRTDRPSTAYQRRSTGRGDGNVRRLADMRDDDDDMTTYNGNSTQQL